MYKVSQNRSRDILITDDEIILSKLGIGDYLFNYFVKPQVILYFT